MITLFDPSFCFCYRAMSTVNLLKLGGFNNFLIEIYINVAQNKDVDIVKYKCNYLFRVRNFLN